MANGESIGGPKDEVWGELDVQKEADRIILNRYTPAGVVINDNMDIVQFRGQTIPYLELVPGKASLNLMKMAREGLFVELRVAIQKARKQGVPVRRKGLHVRRDGEFRDVNIEVVPFLVLFEDAKPQSADEGKRTKKTEVKRTEGRRVSRLNQELAATKEYLRAVIEEQEATNEELKSANEEILSSNEELQNRNFELSQFNNDLNNLLSSVNMPIIMVGSDLCIRRFTPMAEKILNLIPADIGRSISNINLNIDVPNLEQLISDVIETVTVKEQGIQGRDGRWYSMRIRPYRTVENEIKGAVIILVDITDRKRAEETKSKEILLKEIYHMVKNNLQIISSLLNLQSGYVKDPEAIEMFKETQSRIRLMSLIHEQLYKNMELVNIDFNNYIQNLIPYLFHTFGAENRISLKTTGDDIWLNIDMVIPCGLIVNELVSNSLKHAFPGDRKGEVYVGINSNGDGQYVLIVGDNGVGFPEDLDFRSTKSLGLQLVLMLVEQIEGKIELDRTNGTEFKIRFRESGKKQNCG